MIVDDRNRLVEANLALVVWVVKQLYPRFRGAGLSWEDAIQAGRLGLIRAVERWDDRRGTLSTYARMAIFNAVRDAARLSRPVTVPSGTYDRAMRWRRLAAGGMAEPDIIREMRLTPRTVKVIRAALAAESAGVRTIDESASGGWAP